MSYSVSALEPEILRILTAPGTDLSTISAKRVRRQLIGIEEWVTPEFLKENKEKVDALIASVFEQVSADMEVSESQEAKEEDAEDRHGYRKRKQEDGDELFSGSNLVGGEEEEEETVDDDGGATPPHKKAKKSPKVSKEMSDAELARKLSSEINSRSRRSTGATARGKGMTKGPSKMAWRKKKSAETIETDDDDTDGDGEGRKPKPKKKTGTAKGGFAKEYALSGPLAAVLNVDKLSRPQVVKHLWDYIKGNELQNPSNRREIMCDTGLRAVFNVDKIDMFRMNKVLGQHLHEEGT